VIAIIGAALLALAACEGGGAPERTQGPEAAPQASPAVPVAVWYHTGRPAERAVFEAQVAAFNARQTDFRVDLTLIPEGAYNAQVQAATLAGDLPDLLEMDGPLLASYAWSGLLRPLEGLLPEAAVAGLVSSIVAQGTWDGHLYGVGTFDSGLGLFADRDTLAAAGIEVPAGVADAWSADRFAEVLAALAKRDPDGRVLDLKLHQRGEWYTYAFSPLLVSAGADLIDRKRLRAEGTLDGPAAVAALTRVQDWIQAGYVDPDLDDAAFTTGRVALAWSGHWEYARAKAALGDRLAVLPLPDFGHGSRTGEGSWQWGITKHATAPEGAARFLAFLLEPGQVLAMADANGAPPATRAATARSALYGPDGALRLFAEQLAGTAVPRPRTPAYPAITAAFQRAFGDIVAGADVQGALTRAARDIDRDVTDARYPVPGRAAP
jgi:multiple sugar transport system substrate-binding protein